MSYNNNNNTIFVYKVVQNRISNPLDSNFSGFKFQNTVFFEYFDSKIKYTKSKHFLMQCFPTFAFMRMAKIRVQM